MAQGYDAARTEDPVYRTCIQQAVAALQPAGAVLDCGCGTGLAIPYLLGADAVHAVDFSEHMLEQAHRRFAPEQVKPTQGDVRELP